MKALNRRQFMKNAALACPLLAAGGGRLLRAGQQNKPQDDPLIVIRTSCIACGDCADYCEAGAITMRDGLAIIDSMKCNDCGKCYKWCRKGAIIRRSKYDSMAGGTKVDPSDDSPSMWDPVFDNEGAWNMTVNYKDAASGAMEILFVGTATQGVIKSAETNENQGTYKVSGTKFEIKLADGPVARGRVISSKRVAGSLPNNLGLWFLERR